MRRKGYRLCVSADVAETLRRISVYSTVVVFSLVFLSFNYLNPISTDCTAITIFISKKICVNTDSIFRQVFTFILFSLSLSILIALYFFKFNVLKKKLYFIYIFFYYYSVEDMYIKVWNNLILFPLKVE